MFGERKIVTLLLKSDVNVNRPYAQWVVLEKVSITPELEAAHDMGSTSKIGERDQVIEAKISSNDIDNIISELLKIKLDETIKYSKGEVRERPKA
ncbi:hypothetical protein [Taylorella asinigenitalis]|nr:hypothetical protein [Taylorella asinigenitalis]